MVIRTFRQLERSESVDMQRPMQSSAPFPEMSVSSDRDREKVSLLLSWLEGLIPCGDTLRLSAPLSSRDSKSDDMQRQHMVARTLLVQRLLKSLLSSGDEQVR